MNKHTPESISPDVHPESPWVVAMPSESLPPGATRPFRRGMLRMLIARTEDGTVYATDALCPHEGYSLSQGHMSGCVLTCAWHNFKFDVRTGSALMGDESVRTYPTREVAGEILVDVTPPDPEADCPAHYEGLASAIHRGRMGQGIRDAARLLQAGQRPEDVMLAVVAESMARSEYGGGHEPALAADLLQVLPDYPGVEATLVIAQVVELAIETARGLDRQPAAPCAPIPMNDAAIADAVEREDWEGAQAGVRERLTRLGPTREAFEHLFTTLSAAHFLDFGHATIYTSKIFGLLEAATPEAAERYGADIILGHLRGIINGTREDTLPPWRVAQRYLQTLQTGQTVQAGREETLEGAAGTASVDPSSAASMDALEQSVLFGSSKDALSAVLLHRQLGTSPQTVAETLTLAGAKRLLAFDPGVDLDPTVREGWLFPSHVFTHAHAVADLSRRLDHPGLWRHLVYAAFFINRYQALDREPEAAWKSDDSAHNVTAAEVMAAIERRDGPRSVALVGALRAAELPRLRQAVRRWYLDDPATRPIVVTHLIKVAEAALETAERWRTDGRSPWRVPLKAAVHFMAGPRRERIVGRASREAIALVRDGRTPQRIVT